MNTDAPFDPRSLDGLDTSQLEQRRREIVDRMKLLPRSYEDAPTSWLQELSHLTGQLRRKTSGPPKETKRTKGASTAPKATLDDLDSMFS